jgi:hypothetical protein
MVNPKLKILLCIVVSLLFLFAPLLPGVSPDGKVYALGSLFKKAGDDGFSASERTSLGSGDGSQPHKIPEPASWLLFGAGIAATALLVKKLKQK